MLDITNTAPGQYKAQEGTWTLTAPDGRQWTGESPLKAVSAESRERIPPQVALARILAPEPGWLDPAGDEAWRISKSGYSIKQGWGDTCFIVAMYPGDKTKLDVAQFKRWMDNAEDICDAHNKITLASAAVADAEATAKAPNE